MITENGTKAVWESRLPLGHLDISVVTSGLSRCPALGAAEFDVDFQEYHSQVATYCVSNSQFCYASNGLVAHKHLIKCQKLQLWSWESTGCPVGREHLAAMSRF